MTEEEFFRKNYPDSCYGDKPLSPHWDFFQDGVEFGERQSEQKIEELERKLEQTEKDLADYQFNYPTIKELEKQIEKMKSAYWKGNPIWETQNTKIKELQEGLNVAETWNKSLNAMNKELEADRDKYRNMFFDLQEQIEKMKCLKDVIIKAIREDNSDCVWEHAHNGKAKYIYAETVVDIINDKWEL